MSIPAYPSYRESGIEWLGPVPSHWAVCALSHRYSVQLGKMLDEKKITGDHLAPYLRNSDVQWGQINTEELPTMDFSGEELDRFGLRRGDILVCEGGEVGRAAVWDASIATCFYQKALHRLRPWIAAAEAPKFFYYVLSAAAPSGVFNGGIGKATIAHLPAEQFRRHRFAFPPFAEQTAIAAFLDRETAKIDTLVEEQRRLIALLKEKRQAVISHAVTKGLDPSAPMKDSGVEWLGEVPAHWELSRIKWATRSIEQGWSPQCEGFPAQSAEEWGVLKVGCVNGGTFRPDENKALPAELSPMPELGLQTGDILVSRANTRELVGSAALVLQNHPRLMLCDKLYRLRVDEAVIAPAFLALCLQSHVAREAFELAATGASASMVNIGQATVMNLTMALPELDEQNRIVAFVREERERVESMIEISETAVSLLQERRAALISAGVTGKIDVRGALSQAAEAA